MKDLTPNDKAFLKSFKLDKSNLDAEFSNFYTSNGTENSIKRRIVRKYRALQGDFSTLKHRFPSDFTHFTEGYFMKNDKLICDFEAELKELDRVNAAKKNEPLTIEFDAVVYENGKYKKSNRVGEATVNN